jgi:aryl-alcohol dehydrogenase-like predicted oxidoreductase
LRYHRFNKVYLTGPGTADIVNADEELAKKKGVSMAQIALAWMLTKDTVSAPIFGTTSNEKLDDLIGGLIPWCLKEMLQLVNYRRLESTTY